MNNLKNKSKYFYIFLFTLTLLGCDAGINYENISTNINMKQAITLPIGSVSVNAEKIFIIDSTLKTQTDTITGLYFVDVNKNQYLLSDTISNFFAEASKVVDSVNVVNITYAQLLLKISNGLPGDVHLKIIPTDSSGNKIATTFSEDYSISGGVINALGLIEQNQIQNQEIIIKLSNSELKNLSKAQNLIYQITTNMYTIGSRLYFTKNELFSFHLGLFAETEIHR